MDRRNHSRKPALNFMYIPTSIIIDTAVFFFFVFVVWRIKESPHPRAAVAGLLIGLLLALGLLIGMPILIASILLLVLGLLMTGPFMVLIDIIQNFRKNDITLASIVRPTIPPSTQSGWTSTSMVQQTDVEALKPKRDEKWIWQ